MDDDIPRPVRQAVVLPSPKADQKSERYSVVVNAVPVRELLFALARDAKLNVDIHPSIEGVVTLNAIEQTLPQLLNRVARQVELRYELEGANLLILPDTPYLKTYKVDYVNISRDSKSNVNVATQISTTGAQSGGAAGGSGDNNSGTAIDSVANNHFWQTLVENIKDILRETDKVMPDSSTPAPVAAAPAAPAPVAGLAGALAGQNPSSVQPATSAATLTVSASAAAPRTTFREAASVIANPENGIITVRATSRQHESIQEFLSSVLKSAQRQVLIEATVIEVQLSDQYQQGIDWQVLANKDRGVNLVQLPQGANSLSTGASPSGTYTRPDLYPYDGSKNIFGSGNPAAFLLNYTNSTASLGNVAATVSLLQSFGNVKVLSNPKISVLNNQTAILKVVDNKVYFTIEVQRNLVTSTTGGGSYYDTTYTSKINTVPVGFVMSVTPQIDDVNSVTLNVRPTITRILGYVNDPSPALAQAGVISPVPEIQTREMESILKIRDNEMAIMGGLMQDSVDKKSDGVPGLSDLPLIGEVFKYRNEVNRKSELVIMLRPVVVKEPSPSENFFQPGRDARRVPDLPGRGMAMPAGAARP